MRGVKLKPKTRNQVISSPRDENISVLRKESRKSKRRQKQANYFEISRTSTVLISGYLDSFPGRSVVTS